MRLKTVFILSLMLALTTGCVNSLQKQRADVRDDSTERISVGTVQREIKVGMSGSDVVSVLGSPNIVTTDAQRRETWVYDKISTESVQSSSRGGAWIIFLSSGSANSVSSTSQRTLTIVVKFDENNLVRDFAYRQSSF